MARLLQTRDSADRQIDIAERHIRLSRQLPGAETFEASIKPYLADINAKLDNAKLKLKERNAAADLVIFCDGLLDGSVKDAYYECEKYDRDNPGKLVQQKMFPTGRFTDITEMERTSEPLEVERLAVHFESLGTDHPLYTIAARLRTKVAASNDVIAKLNTAIREQKMAEAELEIAQHNIVRQYEANYLDARKLLGKELAEHIFPKIGTTRGGTPPSPPPPASSADAA